METPNGSNGNGNGHMELCPDCHRPVDGDGHTTYQGGAIRRGGVMHPTCRTCRWGIAPLDRGRSPEVQARAMATRSANAAYRNRRPSEVMQERLEQAIERVLRPYFEGLELEPNEEWSPRTKLQFYNEQSQLSEKLLNRTEGLPVARTRTVDGNDDDVLPPQFQNLPPDMLERVLVKVLAGQMGSDGVEAQTVDAEVVREDDGDA